MYEYIPRKTNKKAMYLVLMLLIGGVAVLFSSTLIMRSFRWIFQLIGIGFMTASIFLLTRYISKSFIYGIEQGHKEGYELTVTEVQGKRRITVCRLTVALMSGVETVEASDEQKREAIKKKIKEEGRQPFNYCTDIAPASVCYVFSEECNEKVAVVFQPDETIMSYLSSVKNDTEDIGDETDDNQ